MATNFNIPDWKIPWTEKTGGLQSLDSKGRTRLGD